MELEARIQRLEAELEAIRTRLEDLASTRSMKAPAGDGSAQHALMRSIAEKVQEAGRDMNGMERPLVLQVVSDRPGSTYISMSFMEELRERVDTAAIMRLAGVLSSEPRLKILRALAAGECSAAEAGAAAGLEGGPLYHHLSELQEGGFVAQPSRGRYAMTRRGRDLYYQVALLVRTPYDQTPREC
ncbi:MAG TPA: hypothetical protein VNT75_12985 [Symbiobacteriaceae bacterium]|nr:hypothetical protein [Symbiobacteriaceae bacterium]